MMGLSEAFTVYKMARYDDTKSVTDRSSYMAGRPVSMYTNS